MLASGQEGYTVLGEAYAALRYRDHRLTGYRQQLDMPFVNGDDSKMTPNTFQGVTLFGKTPWLKYGAGYFARGTGARDPANGQALPDEREYDLTVDYRVARKGWLEGLWLRLRGAVLESGGNTQTEVRLILNYAFPVL